MKTKSCFRLIVAIVLAIVCSLSASAGNALTVTRTTMTSDDIFNYKNFEVEASTTGAHHAEFWIHPAELENGTFTEYGVYVNGTFAGVITPSESGWQAAGIDNGAKLSLNAGSNVITVCTAGPEFPDVETVRVAINREEAKIDCKPFESFKAEAKSGMIAEPEFEDNIAVQLYENPIIRGAVSLKYTFYKMIYLEEGTLFKMRTESETPHVVDIVIYANSDRPQNLNSSSSTYPSSIRDSQIISPEDFIDKIWNNMLVSEEEMQQHNWVEYSEYTEGDGEGTYIVTDIPKSGYYLVRVRTLDNTQAGTAKIVFVGKETFKDEVITCSKVDCALKADTRYLSLTTCADPENDDPMLFMHGENGNVVGVNDDAQSVWRDEYELSKRDAALVQTYAKPTTAITVCNFSSLQPKSTCTVISRIPAYAITVQDSDTHIEMPEAVNLGSNLEVSSSDNIRSVTVNGIYGNNIGTVKANDKEVNIPLSMVNVNNPGLYIVTVETDHGVKSSRLFVK